MTRRASTGDGAVVRRAERVEGASPAWDALRATMEDGVEEQGSALEELRAEVEALEAQNRALVRTHQRTDAWARRYQELFELAPDGYLVTDPRGVIREVNLAVSALLDVPVTNLAGKPFVVYLAKAHRARFYTFLARVRDTSAALIWDLELQPRRGAICPVTATLAPARGARGEVVGVRWLLRDATARKRMEAALRESEARLSGIISSAMDAIISVDAAERILLFNPAAERMFRCAAADAVGQSLDRFIPGFLADSGPAEGHGVVGGPMRLLGTWGLRASGDRFPLEASLSRTDLDGEKLWTIIVRDVTERARAELMVRQSRRALETSRGELRALTGLLLTAYEDERRRVSQELHDDVSQRLAAVAVELESLQRGPSRSARSLSAPLGKVHDQVAQLADDVHRLAYALHPRMLDDLGLALALETYLRDLAKRPGVSARMRQRALRSSIPRDHALCLYRVAQEALRNVTRHAGAARVTVTLAGVGGGIALCVKDTGNGFDPAAKGEPRRGLGLVSMEERVRLIDGRLIVRSRPGGGTHVHAWAPLPSGPEDVP